MKNPLLGSALLGLLAAAPDTAMAQRAPERIIPPRTFQRFVVPDSIPIHRVPRDSLPYLLIPRHNAGPSHLTCPMPVSRPDSLSTVPIPRARLAPNGAVPIPVDRTSCRNPL